MADEIKEKTAKPASQPAQPKSPIALREEKTVAFWTKERIFEKSLGEMTEKGNQAPHGAAKGDFVFYDGPPFATGLPHFGHVLPTSIKDAIPRYKTMQGYRVRRRWGWDCHGLPVENLIEKELGLKAKKDIVDYGIGRFNEAARATVLRYEHEWRTIIPRLGRWVDMDHDYETMAPTYTESVWWAFKNLHDKGLIYEGFKSMQICPRCETTLANFEVNQGYKDITDISVYVKFELSDFHLSEKTGGTVSEASAGPTYILAWTTTPWTLPGNVALAVNPDIEYVQVEAKMGQGAAVQNFIFAKDRLEKIKSFLKNDKNDATGGNGSELKIVATMKGTDLVGKSYKSIFDYYSGQKNIKNCDNGWKVYAADFVTLTEGTGIVHIAPAFGPEDMELGRQQNLPFVQHVSTDGKFKKEVADFAGLSVKPKDGSINGPDGKPDKDAHQSGDVTIIKYLAALHGDQTSPSLFAKEKITHAYAHCWRCDTPLLNYAASSWFVKVTDIKDKLVSENKKVAWVPEEVGQGRFGNWLLGARDWAISRSRFWGAPLPVWRTAENEAKDETKTGANVSEHPVEPENVIIGSLEDLKKYSRANNTYFVLRHGEAENNTKNVISSHADTPHHLTEAGKKQVAEAARWLADKNIDLIYVSPFVRTKETAEIVAKHIGVPSDPGAGRFIIDAKIGELNAGDCNGMNFREFISKFPFDKRFESRLPNAENYADIKTRMGDFLYGLEEKYSQKSGANAAGKRILIVTHDSPAFLLAAAAKGLDREQTVALRGTTDHFIKNAEPFELDFTPLPHNREYELDLHRPYIDDIRLTMPDGRRLIRVPEVFDCWFESGSMPYAEAHYPFAKVEKAVDIAKAGIFQPKKGLFKKSKGYPADFIAEGQDQTRGWFYSMLVLGTALFDRAPYKNVIVNGLVLAEDGQKMSKSKGNFPDLMLTVDKFGADALRFYLLSSPLVRAQEFCFAERGVDEVAKKHIGRLTNIVSFYEMYAETSANVSGSSIVATSAPKSTNIIDLWILARLAELNREVTKGLEAYELDRAARPFADFIDDFSTWYIRRSRDRFKTAGAELGEDKTAALATTRYVLAETAKLLAPFMPFLAEDIYQRAYGGNIGKGPKESVHLETWPSASTSEKNEKMILENMLEVRRVASLGLEARMNAKINVRQPLARLSVSSTLFEIKDSAPKLYADFISLIRDEINVKDVVVTREGGLELDTTLTPELKEEGNFRELIRAIQDLRKEMKFTISDSITLHVRSDGPGKDFVEKKKKEIMSATGLKAIVFADSSVSPIEKSGLVPIGDLVFGFSLEK